MWSSNKVFYIHKSRPHTLYVKDNVIIENKWITLDTTLPNVKGMVAYKPKYTLELNDCLQLAESFASGIPHYSGRKCVFRDKISGKVFGFSDKNNQLIASAHPLNTQANPNVGDAYAMVRIGSLEDDTPPYHIAYVMFKDGTTNITLEADSGNEELQDAIFDMYDTTKKGKTFHDRYIDIYRPANTIVLTKRV